MAETTRGISGGDGALGPVRCSARDSGSSTQAPHGSGTWLTGHDPSGAPLWARVTAHPIDRTLAGVEHPNSLPVLAHGSHGRWSGSAHPALGGEPARLNTVWHLDPRRLARALRHTLSLLETLDHVHNSTGRAHGGQGLHSVWIADGQSLQLLDLAAPHGVLTASDLPYASPERLRGQPHSPAGDLRRSTSAWGRHPRRDVARGVRYRLSGRRHLPVGQPRRPGASSLRQRRDRFGDGR